MSTEPTMVRQGDVLVVPIPRDQIQGDPVPIHGKLVLAEGEATGHAHVIRSDKVQMYRDAQGNIFLDVTAPTAIEHEEHEAVWLQQGAYRVVGQREYSPESVRRVMD